MTDVEQNGSHHHTEAQERANREAGLDKTIEASFPASDPPSTNPNPDVHEEFDDSVPANGEADYKR